MLAANRCDFYPPLYSSLSVVAMEELMGHYHFLISLLLLRSDLMQLSDEVDTII